MDEATKEFLKKMGPTVHMTLFHHHQITSKVNNIPEPNDDELVTFEYPDGSEYNIKYGKLKEFATTEQAKFIQDNDVNPEGVE